MRRKIMADRKLVVRITPDILAMLGKLIAHGRFGRSTSEVVRCGIENLSIELDGFHAMRSELPLADQVDVIQHPALLPKQPVASVTVPSVIPVACRVSQPDQPTEREPNDSSRGMRTKGKNDPKNARHPTPRNKKRDATSDSVGGKPERRTGSGVDNRNGKSGGKKANGPAASKSTRRTG